MGRFAKILTSYSTIIGAVILCAFFSFFLIPPSTAFFFEIKLQSTSRGVAQIYYDIGKGMNEPDSYGVPIEKVGVPLTYRFQLPQGTYHALRFDPINNEATVVLSDAAIKDQDGKIVKVFSTSQFMPSNQISSLIKIDEHVQITTEAGAHDPMVGIALDAPILLSKSRYQAFMAARLKIILIFFVSLFVIAVVRYYYVSISGLIVGYRRQYLLKTKSSEKNALSITIISVAFFSCLNVLYFLSQAASPVINSDAWYFLDTTIVKWATAGFDFLDCFVKRGLTDHALPAGKLSLYLSYKYFHLDFRVESLIGFLGLVATIGTFVILYLERFTRSQRNWFSGIMFSCAVLIISSLNATNIYTWTLVTFGFLYIFLAVIAALMVWRYLEGKSTVFALAVTAVVFLLIGDTVTVMVWASLAFCVVLTALSGDGGVRKRAIQWVILTAVFVLTFYLILNGKFLFQKTADSIPQTTAVSWLNPLLYFEILRVVFSSSLVHAEHLQRFGSGSKLVSWLIALTVFGFYARFFILLFRGTMIMTREKFVAVFLLTYATVSIVAIVAGRVPIYGVNYLNQPRYVLSYQLIPFALLLDIALSSSGEKTRNGLLEKLIVPAAVVVFLVFQGMFVITAYKSIFWISQYYDNQAKAIGNYWNNESLPAGNCTGATAFLCDMTLATRNRLLNFLEERKLNIFHPSIQQRYKIYPFDDKISPKAALKVVNWGPQGTIVHTVPNPRPDGYAGIWIAITGASEFGDAQVLFGGKPAKMTIVQPEFITAVIAPEQFTHVGSKEITIRQVSTNEVYPVGTFYIEPVIQQLSDIKLEIGSWGPQSTVVNRIPNPGPDGNAGIWIEITNMRGMRDVQILFGGEPAKVTTVVHSKLITAAIRPDQFSHTGSRELAVKEVSSGKIFPVGTFSIRPEN